MNSFLEYVAQLLKENYDKQLQDITLVMPNKRAALFLKQHLANTFSESIWFPQFITIEDFIYKLAQVQRIDQVQNIIYLYEVYQQISPDADFSEFLHWGHVALHDFNDIDKHAINAKELFVYLNEIKALELWSTDAAISDELSEFQKKYLLFWERLSPLYEFYKNKLIDVKQMPQGMACMRAIKNCEQKKISSETLNKTYVLIGFNAFTKSEEQLLDAFLIYNKLKFIWNCDEYYYYNKSHEAGTFIRHYLSKSIFVANSLTSKVHDQKIWIQQQIKASTAKLYSYESSGVHEQLKKVNQLLVQYMEQGVEPHKIAVVLADEALLVPILYEIPQQIINVNLSIGYPVKYADAYQLLQNIINIRTASLKKGRNSFYFKSFIELLQHNILDVLCSENERISLINHIVKFNLIGINKTTIEKLSRQFTILKFLEKLLFAHTTNDFVTELILFYDLLYNATEKKKYTLQLFNLEVLASIKATLIQLAKITSDSLPLNFKELQVLFNSLSGNLTVNFKGEPLIGLQVVGVLETRLLDFENIILVGVNEGKLPNVTKSPTFFTYDVKMNFNINNSSDNDSIFAFHFYRLLQFSKQIHYLYIIGDVGNETLEKSRFLLQIENELPAYNKQLCLSQVNIEIESNKQLQNTISIKTSKHIQQKLIDKLKSGLSPSAINTSIECSLKFYFQYIQKLKEEEEVTEFADSLTYGNIIHKVLENIYMPYIDKPLLKFASEINLTAIDSLIEQVYKQELNHENVYDGENALTLNAIKNQIHRYLKLEKQEIENKPNRKVIGLEKNVNHLVNVQYNGADLEIKLTGNIDRIDKYDTHVQVVDYKSGKVEEGKLKITDLNKLFEEPKLKYAFQTLFYAYLANKDLDENNLTASIVSFKNFNKLYMPLLALNESLISLQTFKEFENLIIAYVNNLLSANYVFEQTSDLNICANCVFNKICNVVS